MSDEMFLGHKMSGLKFPDTVAPLDPVTYSTCFLSLHFAKYGHAQAFEHMFHNFKTDHLNKTVAHETSPYIAILIPNHANPFGEYQYTIIEHMINYIRMHEIREDKEITPQSLITSFLGVNDNLALPHYLSRGEYKSDVIRFLEETDFFPDEIGTDTGKQKDFLIKGFRNFAGTLEVFFKHGGQITSDDHMRLKALAISLEDGYTFGYGISNETVAKFLTVAKNKITAQKAKPDEYAL